MRISEEYLIESKYTYRELIEMQGEGIGLVDENEIFIYANPSASKIFGFENESMTGKSLYNFLDDEYAKITQKQTLLRKDKIKSKYELKIISADNKVKYLSISSTPKFNEKGKYVGAFAIFSDITDDIKKRDQIILFKNNLQKLVDEKTKEYLKKNQELENEIRQRKELEKELITIKQAVENSISAISIMNTDGEIFYVNQKSVDYWGYDNKNEIIGKNSIEFFKNKKSAKRVLENIINKNSTVDELEAKRKDGSTFYALVAASKIFDKDKSEIGFVASIFDVTQRRRAINHVVKMNRELKQSKLELEKTLKQRTIILNELLESKNTLDKALALKNKMFAVIAHDLRGPFSGFLGLTELIQSEIELMDKMQILELIKSVNKSANALYRLIDDLFVWSRNQIGNIEFNPVPVNLNMLTENVIELFSQTAGKKQVQLINKIETELEIECDVEMTETILRNLISNAIKFSYENSSIIIGNKTKINDNGDYVIFVKDFGIGLSSEAQNKILNNNEKYTTPGTNREIGTGLGLMITKEFVEKHNGKLWLESKKNEGTTFYFSFSSGVQ